MAGGCTETREPIIGRRLIIGAMIVSPREGKKLKEKRKGMRDPHGLLLPQKFAEKTQ
jgi:hypothetical protein